MLFHIHMQKRRHGVLASGSPVATIRDVCLRIAPLLAARAQVHLI
jgi:hypothetical protein